METVIEIMHTQQEAQLILMGLEALNEKGVNLNTSAAVINLHNKISNSAIRKFISKRVKENL